MKQETSAEDLAARYGNTPQAAQRQKIIAIVGAIGVAVVLVVWIVFASPIRSSSQFQARDLGYIYNDDRNITVQFEITVAPNTPMECAVQALNAEYGIVGWRVIDIAPSEQRTRIFQQPLRTSENAVTSLLYRCWVP